LLFRSSYRWKILARLLRFNAKNRKNVYAISLLEFELYEVPFRKTMNLPIQTQKITTGSVVLIFSPLNEKTKERFLQKRGKTG